MLSCTWTQVSNHSPALHDHCSARYSHSCLLGAFGGTRNSQMLLFKGFCLIYLIRSEPFHVRISCESCSNVHISLACQSSQSLKESKLAVEVQFEHCAEDSTSICPWSKVTHITKRGKEFFTIVILITHHLPCSRTLALTVPHLHTRNPVLLPDQVPRII